LEEQGRREPAPWKVRVCRRCIGKASPAPLTDLPIAPCPLLQPIGPWPPPEPHEAARHRRRSQPAAAAYPSQPPQPPTTCPVAASPHVLPAAAAADAACGQPAAAAASPHAASRAKGVSPSSRERGQGSGFLREEVQSTKSISVLEHAVRWPGLSTV